MLKQFIDFIGRIQVVQSIIGFIKPFIWPWVYAMLIGAAGYYTHFPLVWVLMATAMAFAGVAVGIVYADAYRDRHSPLNKIRYAGTITNYDLTPLNRKGRQASKAGAPPIRTLAKTQIGVALFNSAHFPISVILENAKTEMEELEPPRSEYPRPPVLIVPGNSVFVMDDPIDMEGHPCEKLEGRMNLKIRYGLPGKEKYELNFAGRVEALMRPEGFLSGNYTHWDAAQAGLPVR